MPRTPPVGSARTVAPALTKGGSAPLYPPNPKVKVKVKTLPKTGLDKLNTPVTWYRPHAGERG